MYFYNTTNAQQPELGAYQRKALNQDEAVLHYFRSASGIPITPEDVKCCDKFKDAPITSVRRSFSNLQKRGLIEKTDVQVIGQYGRPIYTWRLV